MVEFTIEGDGRDAPERQKRGARALLAVRMMPCDYVAEAVKREGGGLPRLDPPIYAGWETAAAAVLCQSSELQR